MKEYQILEATNRSSLSEYVKDLLSKGWEPQGGVCVSMTYNSNSCYFSHVWAQAMVRELPRKEGA